MIPRARRPSRARCRAGGCRRWAESRRYPRESTAAVPGRNSSRKNRHIASWLRMDWDWWTAGVRRSKPDRAHGRISPATAAKDWSDRHPLPRCNRARATRTRGIGQDPLPAPPSVRRETALPAAALPTREHDFRMHRGARPRPAPRPTRPAWSPDRGSMPRECGSRVRSRSRDSAVGPAASRFQTRARSQGTRASRP